MAQTSSQPFRLQILAPPGEDAWTPTRDANGYVTNWGSIPANRWMQVYDANTKPVTAFTALLDQLRYPYHRSGVTEIIDSYCGMACDNDAINPQAYAFGGGHDSGYCNALMQFSVRKLRWSMKDPSTNPANMPPGYTTPHGNYGYVSYPSQATPQRTYNYFPRSETTPGDNRRCAFHTYIGSVVANNKWISIRGLVVTEFDLATNQYAYTPWPAGQEAIAGEPFVQAAYDAPSDRLYCYGYQLSYLGHWCSWNWGTKSQLTTWAGTGWRPSGGGVHVPSHRKYYYLAEVDNGSFTNESFRTLRIHDYATGAFSNVLLTGDFIGYYRELVDMATLLWHPTKNKLMFFHMTEKMNGVRDADCYLIDAGTGATTKQVPSGTAPGRAPNRTGYYDRMFRVPSTTVWVLIPHANSNAYVLNIP